jgi:hypothetical protein
VRVALWWAPTWRHHHAFDVAERVSFCLLPGELKVRGSSTLIMQRTQKHLGQAVVHYCGQRILQQ